MSEETPKYDVAALEAMNRKAVENNFFTPDNIYIDLALFKDLQLGAIFADLVMIKEDEPAFKDLQEKLVDIVPQYQKRLFHSVEPHLTELGYTDQIVDALLDNPAIHDYIFMCAPTTTFMFTMARHIARNQNHSAPANKFKKKSIDSEHYILEPIEVTCRINTYPLTLSNGILVRMGEQFGEILGVNIVFMNKDPATFDSRDWKEWIDKTDCFYFDRLSRFTESSFIFKKQGDLQFMGKYFFARKRFERNVQGVLKPEEFDREIQQATATLMNLCDFEWLQNNDARLTEEPEDVPMMDDDQGETASDPTEPSGT